MKGKIMNMLKPLGYPVSFGTSNSKAETYITFYENLQKGSKFAEDEEIVTERYFIITVWSKGNYTKLTNDLKKIMKENNFIRRSEHDAPYKSETGHFSRVLRYLYIEE